MLDELISFYSSETFMTDELPSSIVGLLLVISIGTLVIIYVQNRMMNKRVRQEIEQSCDHVLTRNPDCYGKGDMFLGELLDVVESRSGILVNIFMFTFLLALVAASVYLKIYILMAILAAAVIFSAAIAVKRIYIYERGVVVETGLSRKISANYSELSIRLTKLNQDFVSYPVFQVKLKKSKITYQLFASSCRGELYKIYGIINMRNMTK